MSIKCPDCGYPNPEHLETCYKCGGSLRPSPPPPPQPDPPSPPPDPDPVDPPPATTTNTSPPTSGKRASKRAPGILALLFALAAAVWAYNHFSLQTQMDDVIAGDERNEGISVAVHFGSYVDSSKLVYDLKEISGGKSRADVFRVFLQFAQKMTSRRFEVVELRFQGAPRFQIDGDYFHTLGDEYGAQNPVYTIRTFPEHLRNPDGSRAYSEWTGGLLGVVTQQMEDFNDFHTKWYGASTVDE